MYPYKKYTITTPYRKKGTTWKAGYHTGIDIVGVEKEIKSVCEGTVVGTGYDKTGYGNYVVVSAFGGKYQIWYCHLSATHVTKGQVVHDGTILGIEGNTGNSFGSHLHFEVRVSPFNYGNDTDPLEFLDKCNCTHFEYLGISEWHRQGYYGEGINIGQREGITNKNNHGASGKDFVLQVAPLCNYNISVELGEIQGLDLYTTSLFYGRTDLKSIKWTNAICCCAIGNEAEDSFTSLSKSALVWGIGSCALNVDKLTVIAKPYSSASEEHLDFMSLDNLYSRVDYKQHEGTSFASPLLTGMLALVQEFFIKNAGRKLYRNEMYEFIKDNCLDISDKGKDSKTGYGLFILPAPDKIDIGNYIGDDDVMLRYNSIEEIPDWGKPTIQKLMDKGTLNGDENGNLDLSHDMLRMLVIHDREHLYE